MNPMRPLHVLLLTLAILAPTAPALFGPSVRAEPIALASLLVCGLEPTAPDGTPGNMECASVPLAAGADVHVEALSLPSETDICAAYGICSLRDTEGARYDVKIGYDYEHINYGGAGLVWYGTGAGCYGGGRYDATTMPAGWNDRISSSAYAKEGGCWRDHFEHARINDGYCCARMVVCGEVSCKNMVTMNFNDLTSSIAFY